MQHLQGSKLTFVFQSTPSVWRETGQHVVYAIVSIFQSTPSVWRETSDSFQTFIQNIFQSTPSVWRETCSSRSSRCKSSNFNPLPPCGGRHVPTSLATLEKISIHSLRVEGDRRKPCSLYCLLYFNPLPPCGGRPCCGSAMWNFCSISIHSLRVEGDAVVLLQFLVHVEFQSTPSVWRETRFPVRTVPLPLNFNPLPPCGGRQRPLLRVQQQIHFNPLPPCGGRPGSSSGT